MKLRLYLFLFIILLCTACRNNTFNSSKDFLRYLKDEKSGYVKHKSISGYDFALMYKPTDLVIKQEVGNKRVTNKELEELRSNYSQFLYFNLSISSNNQELLSTVPKDHSEFSNMVNELVFRMDKKVNLFNEKKDTFKIVDFIYPRMYGVSKATTILFVYPRDKDKLKDEFLNFTIKEFGLYTGEVKFKIDIDKINNEPHLSFNKNLNEN